MSESVSDPVYPRSPTSEKKKAKISNNERVVSVNSDDKMKVKNSAFHYHRQNSHSYSRKSPRFKLNISFL